MQLSSLLLSVLSLSFVSQTQAAAIKRDDDGPVVVKLTKTVHNVVTNTQIIQGEMSTLTNTVVNTDTTTTTRYTATVTSTVLGTPYTYTTVASTPIDTANIKVPVKTETSAETTTSTTKAAKTTSTTSTKPSITSSTSTSSTSTKSPTTKSKATKSKTTKSKTTASVTDGPDITDIANIPSSTGAYIIDNVVTSKSDGVCYVDYDYYMTDDAEETVTSTSTIYATVTLS